MDIKDSGLCQALYDINSYARDGIGAFRIFRERYRCKMSPLKGYVQFRHRAKLCMRFKTSPPDDIPYRVWIRLRYCARGEGDELGRIANLVSR